MLISLHIRNLITIDELRLELGSGLSVLTGETGAGKSILIDALGLILGDKANLSLVRPGQDKTEVTALFALEHTPKATHWLKQQELDENGECIVRRIISRKGRSQAFINGRAVTQRQLIEFGHSCVEIYGQHTHQKLVKPSEQMQLLDAFGDLGIPRNALDKCWLKWKKSKERLTDLQQKSLEQASQKELLQYQIDELERTQITEDEWHLLEQEQKRLSHASEVLALHQELQQLLYSDEGLSSRFQGGLNLLKQIHTLDPVPDDLKSMFESALIEIQESESQLQKHADRIEINPQRLEYVNQRIETILQLARKLQIQPEEVFAKHIELQQQLDTIDVDEQQRITLEQQLEELHQKWHTQAKDLSDKRQIAAQELSTKVTEYIAQLSMKGGQFSVNLISETSKNPKAQGYDQVEFLVSTNPGLPLASLSKAASGGELSRISLAIRVATVGLSQIPTLIFDEVDAGIGGAVAEITGKQLQRLSHRHQVLCVTHLAQVASNADTHYLIEKSSNSEMTESTIKRLDQEQRLREIARMLGGVKITDKTLDHAQEMLQSNS